MTFDDHPAPKPKIGLTSLIDVIFILIIFFMLVSNFDQFHILKLTTSSSSSPSHIKSPLIFNLMQDGSLYPINTKDDFDTLIHQAIDDKKPVILRIGAAISLQTGIDALDFLHEKGVASVSLQPLEKP